MKLVLKGSLIVLLLLAKMCMSPVEAKPFYEEHFEGTKYIQMNYKVYYDPSLETMIRECLVWNTKTGHSKLYFHNTETNIFEPYEDELQLPDLPLYAEAKGDIMMDYAVEIFKEKVEAKILVWDTKTGKSMHYYYDDETLKFEAYGWRAQLPDEVEELNIKGKIMMDYEMTYTKYYKKLRHEVVIWDTKTGKNWMYYYNHANKRMEAYETQPLGSPPFSCCKEEDQEYMINYRTYPKRKDGERDDIEYVLLAWETDLGYSKISRYDRGLNRYSYQWSGKMPPIPVSSKGPIMLDYSMVRTGDLSTVYYECMTWDRETGRSALYFLSKEGEFYEEYDKIGLPRYPLGENLTGDVLMDYVAVNNPLRNSTIYECLVWDSGTGKSVIYEYDYQLKNFKKSTSLVLPSTLLD